MPLDEQTRAQQWTRYQVRRRDDLLTAVALIRFQYEFQEVDPELSQRAWQLAADRLVEHDVGARAVVDELELG